MNFSEYVRLGEDADEGLRGYSVSADDEAIWES